MKEKIKNKNINEITKAPEEEWVWVDGYKGTDANMCCNNYQYMLGHAHMMPEGSEIKLCESGFHFCKNLRNVFSYYDIGKGNRFFKVHAMVRKEVNHDIKVVPNDQNTVNFWNNMVSSLYDDKLVAKCIIFERELTPDEILREIDGTNEWPDDIKETALKINVTTATHTHNTNRLISVGYSPVVASYIATKTTKTDLAFALGAQEGLSMDAKILAIFAGVN
jgi:hypothetical protein